METAIEDVELNCEIARAEVRAAQEVLRTAQERLHVAHAAEVKRQAAERRKQHAQEEVDLLALPDEHFIARSPRLDTRPYILPFGQGSSRFNPLDDADREGHDFGPTWTAHSTAIIAKKDERTRPTRLIWTAGFAGVNHDSDRIGQRFEARHDQTNARLGEYEIVGLAFYGLDGKLIRTVGEVPNTKFAQATYK